MTVIFSNEFHALSTLFIKEWNIRPSHPSHPIGLVVKYYHSYSKLYPKQGRFLIELAKTYSCNLKMFSWFPLEIETTLSITEYICFCLLTLRFPYQDNSIFLEVALGISARSKDTMHRQGSTSFGLLHPLQWLCNPDGNK